MKSICFVLRVKHNKINDYINIHKKENVWPEIYENLEKAKINKLKIYLLKNNAICFLESNDVYKSLDLLGKQESQKKWNEVTSEYMYTQPNYGSNKIVDELNCIFDYES